MAFGRRVMLETKKGDFLLHVFKFEIRVLKANLLLRKKINF